MVGVRFSVGALGVFFSSLIEHRVQTGSEVQIAFNPMGTGGSCPGDKAEH